MLTNEWMGAFCLGVVWLNTLLIAAHVWQAQRALAREKAALGSVIRARVVDTGGASSLAELSVSQIGRAMTSGGTPRILFTEASRSAQLHGGAVELEGQRIALTVEEPTRVWCVASEGTRSDSDFDAAYAAASTSRGHASVLAISIGARGAEVWLAGTRDEDAMRVRLISDRDPRAVLGGGRARAFAFIVASIAVLAGVTALAVTRPWFSGLSTLGGVLAVAYFLAVQPLGVALREAIAAPDQRRLGGTWAPEN